MKIVFLPYTTPRDPMLAQIAASRSYERGVQAVMDEAGHAMSMHPAIRYPDGRVEVVEADVDRFDELLSPDISGELPADEWDGIWAKFHEAGFTDIWYAHPGPRPYAHYQPSADGECKQYGPRWHAGVWTGPEHDLLCVQPCKTNEEAARYLSPGSWSPEGAVFLAIQKRVELDCPPPFGRPA